MDKKTFLDELRRKLWFLPKDELNKTIAYYSEMISDRIDTGMNEDEAVAAVGNIDDIVNSVKAEIGSSHAAKSTNADDAFVVVLRWLGIIAAYFTLVWDLIFSVGFVIGTVVFIIASIPAAITLGTPALLICVGIALIQFAFFLITIPISGYLRYAIKILKRKEVT